MLTSVVNALVSSGGESSMSSVLSLIVIDTPVHLGGAVTFVMGLSVIAEGPSLATGANGGEYLLTVYFFSWGC